MNENVNVVLMDAERIHRSLNRMAHEIVEKNTDDRPVILFGIDNRGFAIANVLAELLMPIFEQQVQSVQLWLKNAGTGKALEQLQEKEIQSHFMIAVDDVIFSGRTMFSALKKISETLSPSEMHTAVLIDRGHRKFPVQAEFCGMELPTKANEHVSVNVEGQGIQQVILSSKER